MNNMALAAAVAAVLATPLAASGQTQPTAPAPAASAPAPAATAQPADTAKPAKRASHHAPSKADARVCLEFPNNMQIIKCAEKYRYASASQ